MHRHFEEEIEKLKSSLIRMGSLVDEQIHTSMKSVLESNMSLVKLVLERETRVNDLDVKIDRQCQKIFALSQPVANDLRLLLAAMRMNGNIERIGDIAVNFVERVEALTGHIDMLREVGTEEMMMAARNMYTAALDAFVNTDPELARTVFETEDMVDAMARGSFFKLIEVMKRDAQLIEPAAHAMALIRHVERLGDHATNIAEEVIFITEAKLLKHPPHAEEENDSRFNNPKLN